MRKLNIGTFLLSLFGLVSITAGYGFYLWILKKAPCEFYVYGIFVLGAIGLINSHDIMSLFVNRGKDANK